MTAAVWFFVKPMKPTPPPQIKDPLELFDFADSELIIGIVCAVGTDYSPIRDSIARLLQDYGYETFVVRISDLIGRFTSEPLAEEPEGARINARMDAGNDVCRQTARKDLWALAAIAEISAKRAEPAGAKRQAHLLLSLKRPEEVTTLRRVYGDGFFLIGVFATEQERLHTLMEKDVPKSEALKLIQRDTEGKGDGLNCTVVQRLAQFRLSAFPSAFPLFPTTLYSRAQFL